MSGSIANYGLLELVVPQHNEESHILHQSWKLKHWLKSVFQLGYLVQQVPSTNHEPSVELHSERECCFEILCQWHQVCGTGSYPKGDWAGKETSPVWPVSPALQPRWICQSCRYYLMSSSTSDLPQEIICITVETLWGTARDANETRSGDWFLFLLLFPGVMENPSWWFLWLLEEGIQIYAAIF